MRMLLLLTLSFSYGIRIESVPATGNPPDKRAYAGMAFIKDSQCLYLFGGVNEFGDYFNDLWEFNLTQHIWTKVISLSSVKPQARVNFGMFLDDDTQTLYVFGGETKAGFVNDMWAMKPSLASWNQITQKGDIPPLVSFFAYNSFTDLDNKLKFVVHTGRSISTVNDVYV